MQSHAELSGNHTDISEQFEEAMREILHLQSELEARDTLIKEHEMSLEEMVSTWLNGRLTNSRCFALL